MRDIKGSGYGEARVRNEKSLDGCVDHAAFEPPNLILFRLFACICISLVGICSAVVMAQDIEPVNTAYVTWNPDGRYIASATSTTVDIIEASSGDIKNSFPIDRVTHSAAVWSPDGQKIAFATSAGVFEVWSDPVGIPIQEGSYELVAGSRAAAWSPSGEMIAIGDGPVTKIWDVETHTIIASLRTDLTASGVSAVEWAGNNLELYVSQGTVVNLFDYQTEAVITSLEVSAFVDAHGFYINPETVTALSPSEDQLALASDDAVRILDPTSLSKLYMLIQPYDVPYMWGHEGPINVVDWHPDGQYLATGGSDGTLRIWDVPEMRQVHMLEFPEHVIIESVAWSPDGESLAYGSPQGTSEVIIVASHELLPLTTNTDE